MLRTGDRRPGQGCRHGQSLPERVYAGWRDAAQRSAATLDVGKKGAQYARGLKMWGEHPRGTSLSSPCLANALV